MYLPNGQYSCIILLHLNHDSVCIIVFIQVPPWSQVEFLLGEWLPTNLTIKTSAIHIEIMAEIYCYENFCLRHSFFKYLLYRVRSVPCNFFPLILLLLPRPPKKANLNLTLVLYNKLAMTVRSFLILWNPGIVCILLWLCFPCHLLNLLLFTLFSISLITCKWWL